MTVSETGAVVLRAAVGEQPLDVAEHAALVDDAAARIASASPGTS